MVHLRNSPGYHRGGYQKLSQEDSGFVDEQFKVPYYFLFKIAIVITLSLVFLSLQTLGY